MLYAYESNEEAFVNYIMPILKVIELFLFEKQGFP